MRGTRHVIAVVVVATALCADRTVSAAPTRAPRVQPRGLAARITTGFRQTVAPVRLQPARTQEVVRSFAHAIREAASGTRTDLSPLQLHLPPPAM